MNGPIPCFPPTCHDCGFEWKERYNALKTRQRTTVDLLKRLDTAGGLGNNMHTDIKLAIAELER